MKFRVWPAWAIWLLKIFVVAGLYFGAAHLGLLMAVADTNVSPVWPPSGVALVILFLWGYRVWPGIFIGALLANLLSFSANNFPLSTALPLSMVIGVGNTLEAVTGVYLVRRFVGKHSPLDQTKNVFRFTVWGAMVASMVSATIGVVSLSVAGMAPWSDFGYLWWAWWIGNSMGVLLITPLVLVWRYPGRPQYSTQKLIKPCVIFGLLILVTWYTFSQFSSSQALPLHSEYLIIPLVIWASFSFKQYGATVAAFLTASISIWYTIQGYGPFAAGSTTDSLLMLQSYLAIITVTALIVAGIITEHSRAKTEIEQHRHHLKEMVNTRTAELTQTNQQLQQVIKEQQQTEEVLYRRNQELDMLNQANRVLTSTLELDQVLATVLEEIHRLPDVLACSVWLVDLETEELVCRQVTDPQGQIVRGWRLPPGEGLVGWVVKNKQTLNVPDALTDTRHFKGVDEKTGLKLRAILSAPIMVKQKAIGVMQIVDEEPNRFNETHQTLLESLAATAAIAIQNAQLYKQAVQDADTKLALLHEVNHRVKNNLTAIVGLLYAERRHATMEGRTYREIIDTLINRIQGLATVHELLSAAEWRPLPLSDLATQIINASLHLCLPTQQLKIEVTPSPVEVSPAQANQLALAINELATNALKYALPEHGKAQITVSISQEDNMIRLEFRDNGPGYPQEVLQLKKYNVGMYLIQTIVQSGLQGEVSLQNDSGAVTIIQFKTSQET